MEDKLLCSKCQGDMLKSCIKGDFTSVCEEGLRVTTFTTKYVCKECGYIEEYVDDPKFYTNY